MANYTLPTVSGLASFNLTPETRNAVSTSPFTFSTQVLNYPGQRWSVDASIPSLNRDSADVWRAFFAKLNGQENTFRLGDPLSALPKGSALDDKKNLLTFTEQFDDATWTKNSPTVTANTGVAPDGNTTADQIDFGGSTGFVRQTFSSSVNDAKASIYMKGTAGQTIRFELGAADLSFNYIAIHTMTGGWDRVSVDDTDVSSVSSLILTIRKAVANTADVFEVWGAQVEEGTEVTDYQPIAAAYGPFVNGGSQTGGSLVVDSLSPSEDAYLKAGDYIQLGTGEDARLYMVTDDVSTNEDGEATINIWPNLYSSPADNADVFVENTYGAFRLVSPPVFSTDDNSFTNISFTAKSLV